MAPASLHLKGDLTLESCLYLCQCLGVKRFQTLNPGTDQRGTMEEGIVPLCPVPTWLPHVYMPHNSSFWSWPHTSISTLPACSLRLTLLYFRRNTDWQIRSLQGMVREEVVNCFRGLTGRQLATHQFSVASWPSLGPLHQGKKYTGRWQKSLTSWGGGTYSIILAHTGANSQEQSLPNHGGNASSSKGISQPFT